MIDGFGSRELAPEFVVDLRLAGVVVQRFRPGAGLASASGATVCAACTARSRSSTPASASSAASTSSTTNPATAGRRRATTTRCASRGRCSAEIYPVVHRLWWLGGGALGQGTPPGFLPAGRPSGAGGRHDRRLRPSRQLPAPPRHRGDVPRGHPRARAARSSSPAPISCPAGACATRSWRRPGAACAWPSSCRAGRTTACSSTRAASSTARSSTTASRSTSTSSSELHAKAASVDGRWATVGSSNLDPFSLLLAREANVAVFSESVRAGGARRRSTTRSTTAPGPCRACCGSRRPWLARVAGWVAYGCARLAMGIAGIGRRWF